MLANSLSPCIITTKIEASRDFCGTDFGAEVTFDCGWYVSRESGIVLYDHSEREPSPEFKQYYKVLTRCPPTASQNYSATYTFSIPSAWNWCKH